MDITKFLNNNINKEVKADNILSVIRNMMDSCSVALFFTFNQETYILWKHMCSCELSGCRDSIEFQPTIKENICISDNGLKTNGFAVKHSVTNIMTIPLACELNHIGFLCLYNDTHKNFKEDDLIDLSASITLLQILIQK